MMGHWNLLHASFAYYKIKAGTKVATIYSTFLSYPARTLGRNKLITKMGLHTTTNHHHQPPPSTTNTLHHPTTKCLTWMVLDLYIAIWQRNNACFRHICPNIFFDFVKCIFNNHHIKLLFVLSCLWHKWSCWDWRKWFQRYSYMWWQCTQNCSVFS